MPPSSASKSPLGEPSVSYNFGYLLTLSFVTALGGLLFGFDISVISGTLPFIQEYFQLSEAMKGFAVSSVYLGCIVGALVTGYVSERYGRRAPLILTAVLFTVSAIGSGWCYSLPAFVIYRLIGGVGVGMASMLAPLYISEIAPAQYRGTLVSINQLTIVIGILVAYFTNYLLVDLGENNWRWMFASEAVPAVLFLVALLFVPESPRWLVKRGQPEEAARILVRIGTGDYARRVLADIRGTLSVQVEQVSWRETLAPKYRLVLLIGLVLAVFQQFSGINVVFFYAPEIFARTNIGTDAALFQTILVGAVNLLFTLLAMRLVDRLGRRQLLTIGSLGMAICYVVIGALFYLDQLEGVLLLAMVLLTIAFYATSLAPVTWVLLSEIFPNRIRGMGMSLATMALWVACYVLTLTFPIFMEKFDGAFTFWIYAGVCVLGFLFIRAKVPETKGKTLEELEELLVQGKKKEMQGKEVVH